MRFYTKQHGFYCGIDLHARSMYVCILNQGGEVVVHRNMEATPEAFLQVIGPYRGDAVVAVECIFTWYWLADLCAREKIAFVLGLGGQTLTTILVGSRFPALDSKKYGIQELSLLCVGQVAVGIDSVDRRFAPIRVDALLDSPLSEYLSVQVCAVLPLRN